MSAKRSAWLVAAITSATVGVFIAAKVCDLSPAVTAIDVGALGVTAFLSGLFAGLHLKGDSVHAVPGQ